MEDIQTVQMTDFQIKKINRDREIRQRFASTAGAVTKRVEQIARDYSLTPWMIYKILKIRGEKK